VKKASCLIILCLTILLVQFQLNIGTVKADWSTVYTITDNNTYTKYSSSNPQLVQYYTLGNGLGSNDYVVLIKVKFEAKATVDSFAGVFDNYLTNNNIRPEVIVNSTYDTGDLIKGDNTWRTYNHPTDFCLPDSTLDNYGYGQPMRLDLYVFTSGTIYIRNIELQYQIWNKNSPPYRIMKDPWFRFPDAWFIGNYLQRDGVANDGKVYGTWTWLDDTFYIAESHVPPSMRWGLESATGTVYTRDFYGPRTEEVPSYSNVLITEFNYDIKITDINSGESVKVYVELNPYSPPLRTYWLNTFTYSNATGVEGQPKGVYPSENSIDYEVNSAYLYTPPPPPRPDPQYDPKYTFSKTINEQLNPTFPMKIRLKFEVTGSVNIWLVGFEFKFKLINSAGYPIRNTGITSRVTETVGDIFGQVSANPKHKAIRYDVYIPNDASACDVVVGEALQRLDLKLSQSGKTQFPITFNTYCPIADTGATTWASLLAKHRDTGQTGWTWMQKPDRWGDPTGLALDMFTDSWANIAGAWMPWSREYGTSDYVPINGLGGMDTKAQLGHFDSWVLSSCRRLFTIGGATPSNYRIYNLDLASYAKEYYETHKSLQTPVYPLDIANFAVFMRGYVGAKYAPWSPFRFIPTFSDNTKWYPIGATFIGVGPTAECTASTYSFKVRYLQMYDMRSGPPVGPNWQGLQNTVFLGAHNFNDFNYDATKYIPEYTVGSPTAVSYSGSPADYILFNDWMQPCYWKTKFYSAYDTTTVDVVQLTYTFNVPSTMSNVKFSYSVAARGVISGSYGGSATIQFSVFGGLYHESQGQVLNFAENIDSKTVTLPQGAYDIFASANNPFQKYDIANMPAGDYTLVLYLRLTGSSFYPMYYSFDDPNSQFGTLGVILNYAGYESTALRQLNIQSSSGGVFNVTVRTPSGAGWSITYFTDKTSLTTNVYSHSIIEIYPKPNQGYEFDYASVTSGNTTYYRSDVIHLARLKNGITVKIYFKPATWQLREFDFSSSYDPNIVFSKPTNTILRIDSYSSGSGSIGTGYVFITVKKDLLNGKKLKINWNVYYSYPSDSRDLKLATLYVFNANFERNNMLNYFKPNQNREPIFDYTCIEATHYPGPLGVGGSPRWLGWRIDQSNTLDLSSMTSNYVTILIRMVDGWTGQTVMVDIDYLQILDSTDNIVAEYHFTGNVIMEVAGTLNDYGITS